MLHSVELVHDRLQILVRRMDSDFEYFPGRKPDGHDRVLSLREHTRIFEKCVVYFIAEVERHKTVAGLKVSTDRDSIANNCNRFLAELPSESKLESKLQEPEKKELFVKLRQAVTSTLVVTAKMIELNASIK